jgi:hypothetical protein
MGPVLGDPVVEPLGRLEVGREAAPGPRRDADRPQERGREDGEVPAGPDHPVPKGTFRGKTSAVSLQRPAQDRLGRPGVPLGQAPGRQIGALGGGRWNDQALGAMRHRPATSSRSEPISSRCSSLKLVSGPGWA